MNITVTDEFVAGLVVVLFVLFAVAGGSCSAQLDKRESVEHQLARVCRVAASRADSLRDSVALRDAGCALPLSQSEAP